MNHLRRAFHVVLLFVTLAAVSSVSKPAFADDADEVATYAVQKRLFREGLELHAGVGILPLNAFRKSFVVNGNVTYHFTNTWGWEVAQAAYVFAQTDTDLLDQLKNNYDVQPTSIKDPQFLGSTNILFTPFYGKLAGLNHTVSHIELFFPIGPALGRYQDPGEWRGGIDIGLGIRWFLTTHTSLRLEARDFLLTPFSTFAVTQELLFALGLSVEFGGAER